MYRNLIIILTILLFILSIFILCSCALEILKQRTVDRKQAITDARNAIDEVHLGYLSCYALGSTEKQVCTGRLAEKHLSRDHNNNFHYITNYQYEAEKLGFVKFLKNNKLACDNLATSPTFIDAARAYLVTCQNGNNYFMRFDYGVNEWELVAQEW